MRVAVERDARAATAAAQRRAAPQPAAYVQAQRLLTLQRRAGNRAVSSVVSSGGRLPHRGKVATAQRDADESGGGMCCSSCASGHAPCEADEGEQAAAGGRTVQRDGGQRTPTPAAPLAATGSLEHRTTAFKNLVKTTAIHRLMGNQTNLGQWVHLISAAIPAGDLAALGLAQGGGTRPYLEMQIIEDPMVREIRANQVMGRYRACTGCHLENQAWGTREERSLLGGTAWTSPEQQRASPFGYQPPAGSSEARVHQLFPSPTATMEAIQRVRPMLAALGPDGYKVLPGSVMTDVEAGSFGTLRATIRSNIDDRVRDYAELVRKIRAGDVGYEHFAPIIRDLLPAADQEVRRVIQTEMDDNAFWAKFEAVVVGVLSVAALILTIWPPTSALGVAALGALEVGLGAYGAAQAPGMISTGQAYSLGTGAHDVFTPGQQAAGGGMVVSGFLGAALAPLALYGGATRIASATGGVERGLLALQAGETMQTGKYLITMSDDGSLVVALADRPNVMIVVRNGTATAYEVTGTGGLRMLDSAPVRPPGGAASTVDSGAGGGFEGRFPHVSQKQPNWCGAACGEMAAGRLGVEVTQEQLVNVPGGFQPRAVIRGQEVSAGGFQTQGLRMALEEAAPVAGRQWFGGTVSHDISTAAGLQETMNGFLGSSQSSVILRVKGGNHWIVVDEVLADGRIAIRDPGARTSSAVTAEELLAMGPTGDVVMSFPKRK